jgi:hypothetical protein
MNNLSKGKIPFSRKRRFVCAKQREFVIVLIAIYWRSRILFMFAGKSRSSYNVITVSKSEEISPSTHGNVVFGAWRNSQRFQWLRKHCAWKYFHGFFSTNTASSGYLILESQVQIPDGTKILLERRFYVLNKYFSEKRFKFKAIISNR